MRCVLANLGDWCAVVDHLDVQDTTELSVLVLFVGFFGVAEGFVLRT